jgi:hypothetical protein
MSLITITRLLLAVTSLAWLVGVCHASTATGSASSQKQKLQHQLPAISSESASQAQRELQDEYSQPYGATSSSQQSNDVGQQQTSTGISTTNADSSPVEPADSVEAMLADNYLKWTPNNQQIVENQIVDSSQDAAHAKQESSDGRNPFDSHQSNLSKSRRQAEQTRAKDWWTKLVNNNNKTKRVNGEQKASKQTTRPNSKGVAIYREQPLEQNVLLTFRHQLMAIRDKHRLLMLKSVPQLMKLDQKLVDSYRLCLRRNMPLYAGMLYRTRDYVVRMANEIKHERQILEATAKQIQKALRYKSSNSSLVRDYNRQLAMLTSSPSLTSSSQARPASLSSLKPVVRLHYSPPSPSSSSPDGDVAIADNNSNGPDEGVSKSARAGVSSSKVSSSNELADGNESAGTAQRSLAQRKGATKEGLADGGGDSDEVLAIGGQQRTSKLNNLELAAYSSQDKSRSKFKKYLNTLTHGGEDQQSIIRDTQQKTDEDSFGFDGSATDTKRQRQRFYTVNVNEVNLKRELTKTQALIDRVNSSAHELMSVVDDIIYLFKLSTGDSNPKRGLATTSKINKFDKLHSSHGQNDLGNEMDHHHSRARKMLKSPLKLLFEKYAKSTISMLSSPTPNQSDSKSTTISDFNMVTSRSFNGNETNMPEMKPIFDPSNFAAYKDPVDVDLGFDAPASLEI